MRNHSARFIPFLLPLLFIFTSFNLFAQKPPEQLVVSGTVLLPEKKSPESKVLLEILKTEWKLTADSINFGEKTLVFNTYGGATVMIAYLDYPAAFDEIGAAARLSWLWNNAAEESGKHQAQVVISVIGNTKNSLDIHKIFTQVAAALLDITHAPGIFLGDQYLLLSSGYYTAAARNMVQYQTIPLYCWVYFGRPGGGNGFTYGLTEFGLPEMEIVNSSFPEAEVHATLYDAAMSVVKYGTILQDGQTLTTEEGTKTLVRLKKGSYLEEKNVLSIEF